VRAWPPSLAVCPCRLPFLDASSCNPYHVRAHASPPSQELKLSAGPKVAESIARINAAFPTECVKFSDPSYARDLVARLEE
jgi:hypothetical protein